MHLRGLALFREIYWAGSITAGAAALHISQPAASRMLRHLEDQLGYALFERSEGRARPTAEAQVLIHEVDEIFARVKRTSQVARNLKKGGGERLAVVGPHHLTITLLPTVLKRLQSRFPDLELALDAQGLDEQLNSLECRRADICIAADLAPPPGVEARPLGRSGFVAVMPATHPLAAERVVELADYARFPAILWGRVGPLGRLLTARFDSQGIQPDIRLTIGSPLLVENLVRSFGYLSIIDKAAAASLARAPGLAVRDLRPEIEFGLFAFWRLEAPPSAIREAFLEILADALRPILEDEAPLPRKAAIG
ncbi:MAG: LysR family transcriptional regulator [Rhizobiales bacterium]|nr:LysR family transcriptional regulator [Hyphomicrobiales bacterium]